MPVPLLSACGFNSDLYALGIVELLVPFPRADGAQLQDIVDYRRLAFGFIADTKGAARGL